MPARRVEPVSTLPRRDAHDIGPLVEQRRHALDVGAPFLGDLCPRRELDDYRIDARFHRPSIARSCAISRRQKSRVPAAGCGTTKSRSDAVCVS